MTLEEYQSDLRRSYVGGGVGTIFSGVVWALAAMVCAYAGVEAGFITLFFGGMLIFPVGTLLCRLVFKRAKTHKENPGGRIVIETLPGMFLGLFLAYVFIGINSDLVFPIAAMAVGTHYFGFRTAYGDLTYWVLGGVMVAVGTIGGFSDMPLPFGTATVIAVIEVVFGVLIMIRNPSSS